ncbi:MAG: DUF4268 domain-containing protein [Gammaproteobacteria bacterium]|nr:DUF4268 domain-containing protein [Gammaproteobacteria bacterium]
MSINQELGLIEKVDLRNVWKNEAKNFTPWLVENISKLGEALRMELEVEAMEAPVGSFALDILVRVVESGQTGRVVIIENQFEQTDHDHLGKLITYAAGYEAGIIVWITEQFKEEHRQALDWLNRRSDDSTEFFGIQIELWKIGNSRPAPRFNLIVTPNAWQRESKRNLLGRKISTKDRKYEAFFQKLLDGLREINFCKTRTSQPTFQCTFPSGFGKTFRYKAAFDKQGTPRIELNIDSGSKSRNDSIFEHLHRRKEEIQRPFEETLNWENLDNNRYSRIFISYKDGTIDDEDSILEDVRSWMEEKLVSFRANFKNVLDDLEYTENDEID